MRQSLISFQSLWLTSFRDVLQGKQGPVVHLSKQMLFVQSRDVKQNGGFFCVAARNCKVFGGNKTDPFAVSVCIPPSILRLPCGFGRTEV